MSSRATVTCSACGKANRIDMSRAGERPRCGACGTEISLDRPIRLGDADFERVVAGTDVPLVVDFYADWCGPCKVMAPLLDALASERRGEILVAKLDTDASPETSRRYGIRAIPTLIAFRGGKEVAREQGAVPRPRIDALVARAGLAGGG